MTTSLAKSNDEALMARQLTEQYQRAVGGLWEVMKFGAMMLHLQKVIVSTRGHVRTGGPGSKGTGIEGWLAEHCPDIARTTAYRFMALAEGLKAEFKLGVKIDLQALLMTDVDDLPEKLKKIRAEIGHFLEGKSQRQLLLSFGRDVSKSKGGDNELQKWLREHYPDHAGARLKDLPKSVKAEWSAYVASKLRDPELLRELARSDWESISDKLRTLGIDKQSWKHLTPRSLEHLRGLLMDVAKLIGEAIEK